MYSLYRAWLMRDAVAAATLASPPDVIINVGGSGGAASPPRSTSTHQFAAHRAVLASHSGYLKALLTAAATSPTSGNSNTVTISVPNVSPEAFAPLLTFMYTGYLDVTHENIYGVLLATHLLHMPRALDLCRAFLVQNQQPQSQTSLVPHSRHPPPQMGHPSLPTLVKPIPSRKMLPVLLGLGSLPPPPPPPAPFWPPPTYHHPLPPPQPPQLMLPSADSSPFRSVLPTSVAMDTESIRENHEPLKLMQPAVLDIPARPPTPHASVNNSRRRPKSPLAIPSTSTSRRSVLLRATSPSTPSSVSPCLSGASFSSEDRNVVSDLPVKEHRPRSERSQHQQQLPQKKHQPSSKAPCKKQQPSDVSAQGTSTNSKVIIDVACCDGPVRFHRVLNDNYGLTLDDILAGEPPEENTSRHDSSPLQNNQEPKITELGRLSAVHKPNPINPQEEKEEKLKEHTSQHPMAIDTNDDLDQNTMQKHVVVEEGGTTDADMAAGSEDRNTSNLSEPQVSEKNKEESSAPNLSDGNTSSSSASMTSEKVGGNSGNLETVYTCLYCNHTFKSHYCYQKHARRHINPVTIDLSRLAERLGANKGVAVCKILGVEKDKVNGSGGGGGGGGGGVRREVRLLDMNVQYYPCKTCGSKFPSYYFVHKHRKMCHANEETESLVGSEESRSQSQAATSV
ncbi:B-cell lymphoma 6 protein [Periplaneta americana]|uniref:B-cell lymphoma 6 protein n=1 Tax=Periplaneta americana TaxID=6978 RepID=UPI0037E99AD8